MAQRIPESPEVTAHTEEAWVSVIQKMDEAYADLVHYQVEIEDKNAELNEAKSFFDSVQGSMSDLLMVCDHQGVVQQVNRSLELLVGQSQSALVGVHFSTLVSACYQQKVQSFSEQLRLQPIRDCEIALTSPQGDIPLSMNCSPRKDSRGRLIGMVMVGRPLGELQKAYKALNSAHAELKLAQERLIQAEKMASLGRLVAGVAHELNNPISFVYGNMHALKRYTAKLLVYFDEIQSGASRESLKELRETLRLDKAIKDLNSLVDGTMEGADRVRDIVNDLKQFSSTQASAKTEFDLVHVVRSALQWIIKESKHTIRVEDNLPDYLQAWGHSGQIHQVVVNLLQNAADALKTTPTPLIKLSAGTADNQVWMTVEDNGPGIPAEDLSRLFDPFFTTKPVGEGTGLGLSISYGIAIEHGGILKIENQPHGGAIAEMVLPLKECSDV